MTAILPTVYLANVFTLSILYLTVLGSYVQ